MLVVEIDNGFYLIFAGNLRRESAPKAGLKSLPCVVYTPENESDQFVIKRRALKDNGSFGSWDEEALANEWGDLPLADFGIPLWDPKAPEMSLSTKGREGADGYDEFVDKFNEELPLTTDDCYTPPEVYDCVRDFVDKKVTSLKGRKIVRPFYPGGNYEDLKQYSKNCVVLDNPPFSIYAKIVRFYLQNGIDFFLFGPNLTLFIAGADACFCAFNTVITYENGAKVNTGFVTNLRKDLRIWVEHTLRDTIAQVQQNVPTIPVYDYPDEVITSALLGKVANGGDLEIRPDECEYIHNVDGFKKINKGLYGGGYLLSTEAAARVKKAVEDVKAAAEERNEAEKSRYIKIELSAPTLPSRSSATKAKGSSFGTSLRA